MDKPVTFQRYEDFLKERNMDKPDDKDILITIAFEAIHHLRRFRDSIAWRPADGESGAHSLRVINSEDIDTHAKHAANALAAWDEARRGKLPTGWVKASAIKVMMDRIDEMERELVYAKNHRDQAVRERDEMREAFDKIKST